MCEMRPASAGGGSKSVLLSDVPVLKPEDCKSVSQMDRTLKGGDPMDNDKTIIERLVRIEQDAQSIYDEAKAEKEKRRQELEARMAAFDADADAELTARLSAVKTRLVREHSENTNRMEADMSRALRMLDKEFASQMKKDADDIVKEILK